MRKLSNWSLNLLLAIGGVCAITTILGLLFTAGGLIVWIVVSPFVALAQEQPFRDFTLRFAIATLPFFAGSMAIALTTNTLSEAECERSERQARLRLSQTLNQNQQSDSIAATNSLALDLAETQRRVRDLELLSNSRIDEQIRLLNRIAELEAAIQGLTEDTDFYPADPLLNSITLGSFRGGDSSPDRSCLYWHGGSIRCAVHPDQPTCDGCRDYREQ